MTAGENYVRDADRTLETTYEEPISLEEYVDAVFENPTIAAHATKYLLAAIEDAGTRTVIEEGEEKERYRFFDDPYNGGEHAVLGNTEVLNGFVEDLRAIAAGRGKAEKIIWFAGPTATGKSEFKRCLISGLREFSKTEAGRRYTIEWNISGTQEGHGLSYGDDRSAEEDDWYESPVQANPLTVFPPETRETLLSELNEQIDAGNEIRCDQRLDPFSREAFDFLEEQYRRQGKTDLFSAVTDERHLRVKNYVVDVGTGIGVLHAEDSGSPKERLVGGWMPEMLRELDSRGRKNPQAFSYDGVLSQGNGGLTIVEDATQHADLLHKLLNVPDEGSVKLDKGIGMDIDTQMVVISNPDLESQLNQHADRQGQDPLKALKRRLDKREIGYLTNISLEVELIRRELTGEREVWEAESYETLDDRIVEGVTMSINDGDGQIEREFAPHAIEAAALYDVVTRLDADDLPNGIDITEKALLYDRGYLTDGEDRRETDDFDFDEEATDGEHGIPVTYTRDVLAGLLAADTEREHPELPVEQVIMPEDILNTMAEGLRDAPVFSASERGEFENRVVPVKDYIFDRQEADVLEAMLADHRADEATVTEYVEHVYAWATDEPLETDRGEEIDPDPLTMKVFEIEQLGRFEEDDYAGTQPSGAVEEFRREQLITALNRRAWQQRDEGFEVSEVDLTEIPALQEILATNDWDDVRRIFEDFDPRQWADPPTGTETATVKRETIDGLIERGYTAASAELTSQHVMDQVSYRWD
ncbi:MAG: PrkA family serine protein kinase [Halobacteriales archaeon]